MTMSRRNLQFTDAARRDFRSIQRYSLRTWGKDQRDAYAEVLMAKMQELTQYPALGPSLEGEPAGLRYRPVEDHVIYYRIGVDVISIVRILHKRRDVARLLEGR